MFEINKTMGIGGLGDLTAINQVAVSAHLLSPPVITPVITEALLLR